MSMRLLLVIPTALPAAVDESSCARPCHGRTCGELRQPPEGVSPLHCSSLRYIGCDCTGCCIAQKAHQANQAAGTPASATVSARSPLAAPSEVSSREPSPTGITTPEQSCISSGRSNFTGRACWKTACSPLRAAEDCSKCACVACPWCTSPTELQLSLDRLRSASAPPPPSPPGGVEAINRMWREGKPSPSVAEAGVVVRVSDSLMKVKGLQPWEPCPSHMWCAKYGGIWPSSLVNERYNKPIYAGRESGFGFVLAPPPLNRFFCIYPRDGNSMGHVTPRGADRSGCQRQCGGGRDVFDCSYPPEMLEECLKVNSGSPKYNEIVIAARSRFTYDLGTVYS